MTCRLSRLIKQTFPNPAVTSGRKPRILPMSREDERFWADRQRRLDREHGR